jgi:hypothetical protein
MFDIYKFEGKFPKMIKRAIKFFNQFPENPLQSDNTKKKYGSRLQNNRGLAY